MTAPYSGGHYDFEPQRLRELHSKNQQRCHDAMEWLASKKNDFAATKILGPKKHPQSLMSFSPLKNDGNGKTDPASF